MSENKVMEAGRELDLAVAVRVMGAHIKGGSVYMNGARYAEDPRWNDGSPRWLPHYSTSITDAWVVVDEVLEKPAVRFSIYFGDHCKPTARFFHVPTGEDLAMCSGETAPLAICLAALAALESKG